MGKKDINQSNFFDNKERFADIFNGVLFKGKEIIQATELGEADSVMVMDRGDYSHKIIADKVRKWHGIYISVLMQENQSYIDYAMVIRVMKEEAACYDNQRRKGYEECTGKNQIPDSHERLSGMMKDQRLLPVITLVLYLGEEKPWDGKTELHHLLELPDQLKPFVSNYKINLYDYHDHHDFSHFKTENRFLLELLSISDRKEKIKRISENKNYHFSKDREVAKAMLGILGINCNINKIYDKEEGGYDMRRGVKEWADELKAEGRLEGLTEGRLEGLTEGRLEGRLESTKSIINTLYKKGYLPGEIACMLDLENDYVIKLADGVLKNK